MVLHIANAIRGRGRNIRRDHHAYDYGTFRHQIYLQSSKFKVQFRFATEPGSFPFPAPRTETIDNRCHSNYLLHVRGDYAFDSDYSSRELSPAGLGRAGFAELERSRIPRSQDASDLEADLPYIRTSSHHGRVVQV